MADFNFKVRIPTNKEYVRFMDIAAEDNSITYWNGIFSWVYDPEIVAEYPNLRALRGYYPARYSTYTSAVNRSVIVGFRPAFEPLGSDTLPAGTADGDVVVIGTLYMDGKPVKVPQNPEWDGDIKNYILGAKLEFGPALEDSAYQVQAIKCGDVFICDRCLLNNISCDDIQNAIPSRKQPTAKENSHKEYTLENTISEDCELWETLRHNSGHEGDCLYLNVCKNSKESGLYQLILNGLELWYGTLKEINAVVKSMIIMIERAKDYSLE